MSRERGWLTLAQAIHKITDKPARRFHLAGRGRIEKNYIADLTIFDAAAISSAASYDNPAVPPVGIVHVFREGRPLLRS